MVAILSRPQWVKNALLMLLPSTLVLNGPINKKLAIDYELACHDVSHYLNQLYRN